MRVFDLSSPIPSDVQNAVVVVGNFDAVHCGHQALIAAAKDIAHAKNSALAVLTFEPHPRRLFRPDDAPFRVTPLSLKLERLAACGVDTTYVCPFDWTLAGLSPEQFVKTILQDKLNPLALVIGQDFHFGHNRTGNADFLRAAGLDVHSVPLVHDKAHAVISATRIRGALQAGHIDEANALLGWDWEIRGVVGHGDKRGRTIGYPTANVALGDTIHPAYGVYATWVKIEGEDLWRASATNIGVRPMFESAVGLVETYIFDFDGDLYGKTVHIRPVQKIRDEMKFSSLEELIKQIDADCVTVRAVLAR